MIAGGVTGELPIGASASNTGVVVLGRWPTYLQVAKDIGGKVFSVPTEIWEKLSQEEQWTLNQKFIDDAIANGDQFFLASSWADAAVTSFFYKELTYLFSLGYTLSPRGNFLIPPW